MNPKEVGVCWWTASLFEQSLNTTQNDSKHVKDVELLCGEPWRVKSEDQIFTSKNYFLFLFFLLLL